MLRRFLAILIVLGILSAIGLIVVYSTTVRPIETETCPVVERYFAEEQVALATLNTNGLESVATGGALLDISGLVEGKIKNNNNRLYLMTTIEHCRLNLSEWPSANNVLLEVGFTTRYFKTDPNAGVTPPISTDYLSQLFLVAKVAGTWKVSEITSPR
jgi:hypothetical protein